MDRTNTAPKPCSWHDIVRLTGDDGCRWMAEYSRWRDHVGQIIDAVAMMRRGQLEDGPRVLAGVWDQVAAAREQDPSVHAVIERWYLGAVGYYHYCRTDFDQADAAMTGAYEALADALSQRSFLKVMADEAVELTMHRARIARNRGRWGEMRAHIDTVRGMREGTVPYFVLRDGAAVWLSDVRAYLDALPAPDAGQPLRPEIQRDDLRRQDTDRFERDVLRIPGFVIQ